MFHDRSAWVNCLGVSSQIVFSYLRVTFRIKALDRRLNFAIYDVLEQVLSSKCLVLLHEHPTCSHTALLLLIVTNLTSHVFIISAFMWVRRKRVELLSPNLALIIKTCFIWLHVPSAPDGHAMHERCVVSCSNRQTFSSFLDMKRFLRSIFTPITRNYH